MDRLVSLCRFACSCPDLLTLAEKSKKRTMTENDNGILESHQKLCTTNLNDYCSMHKTLLFNYLLNPQRRLIGVC